MSGVYWHLYTGVTTDPALFVSSVIGPTTLGPDDLGWNQPADGGTRVRDLTFKAGFGTGELTYVTSFDHEPTDDEKNAHTPEAFREDE